MGTIIIPLPPEFNYHPTILLNQRGADDPINHIEDNTFTRCYRLNNEQVLIKIALMKDQHAISINLLAGQATAKEITDVINLRLGLDDPLLKNPQLKIPHKEKLLAHWGITAPGYNCYFEALVHIILGQQVSLIVANRMRSRFTQTYGSFIIHQGKNYFAFPRAEVIAALSMQDLRALGISETKSKGIIALAKELAENDLEMFIKSETDIAIIRERLQSIYCIGRWTADWFLLWSLRRFEIIASTDLVIRKAFSWWANKKEILPSEALDHYAKRFHPYGGALTYRILSAYLASLK